MAEENRFKERYQAGDTPWDIGKPDFQSYSDRNHDAHKTL